MSLPIAKRDNYRPRYGQENIEQHGRADDGKNGHELSYITFSHGVNRAWF